MTTQQTWGKSAEPFQMQQKENASETYTVSLMSVFVTPVTSDVPLVHPAKQAGKLTLADILSKDKTNQLIGVLSATRRGAKRIHSMDSGA